MPLESATNIPQLDAANPTATDGLGQGDDHIRLVKAAVKGSFPNFDGSVAVTATEAQINSAVDKAVVNGVAILSGSGAFFKGTTDGITDPVAGEIDVVAGGNVVAKFTSDKKVAFQDAISAVGNVSSSAKVTSATGVEGPGAIPVGGTLIWWSDTLPNSATWGTWAWCNGGTYLRSSPLFAIIGTAYGAGDGSTTAGLPDLRDNVPVGKGTMGGASAAGRITNFVTSTLGNLFGECLHLLGIGEMPSHSHTATSTVTDPGHTHAFTAYASTSSSNAQAGGTANPISAGGIASATTGITVATSNANTGGGASHNNVQPSTVCNYIIRVA